MDIEILYQDQDIMVINKPPGLIVNRAESVKTLTLQDWMETNYVFGDSDYNSDEPFINQEFKSRSGIVHRIDKETSGILLIARNAQAFGDIKNQFMDKKVTKTYLAIVHGFVSPPVGDINVPVGRLPWDKEKFGIVPNGKESLTKYKVIKQSILQIDNSHSEPVSLIEVYPQTGRTHQIRVHMKYINHPLVGDYLYAGRKTARDDRIWAKRVMLHACKILFTHPRTKQFAEIECPIPKDMTDIIENIYYDK